MTRYVVGIYHNLMSLEGPTRLFLSMMDVFKSMGWQVRIYTRSTAWTQVWVKQPRGLFKQMRIKERVDPNRTYYPLKDLKKYHPLAYLQLRDIRVDDMIPLRHPYLYFSEQIREEMAEADYVFTAVETYLRLNEFLEDPSKFIAYIHFPPTMMWPSSREIHVWVNSEWTGQFVNEFWKGKEVEKLWGRRYIDQMPVEDWEYHVVYPPCNVEAYTSSRSWEERPYDIVIFSRLTKDKIQLVSHLEGYRVLVIGADYGGEVPSWVECRKNLTFHEVAEYLSKSKVYLHCKGYQSEPEHFGQTIVEAMASGCAVVAPNAGGPVEILDHGKYGILFEDPMEMKEAIDYLLSSSEEWRYFHKKATDRSKYFDYEHTAKRIREALDIEE